MPLAHGGVLDHGLMPWFLLGYWILQYAILSDRDQSLALQANALILHPLLQGIKLQGIVDDWRQDGHPVAKERFQEHACELEDFWRNCGVCELRQATRCGGLLETQLSSNFDELIADTLQIIEGRGVRESDEDTVEKTCELFPCLDCLHTLGEV